MPIANAVCCFQKKRPTVRLYTMYAATLKNSAKPNALSIRSVRLRAWRHDHKRSASHNDNVNDDAPSTAPPAFAAAPLTASQTQRTPCSKNRCFPVFESRGLRIAHQYTCNMHAWATPEVAPSTAAASCMRAADVAMTRLDLCSEVVTSFVALSSWDVVLPCTLRKCDPWATNTTDLPPPRRTHRCRVCARCNVDFPDASNFAR